MACGKWGFQPEGKDGCKTPMEISGISCCSHQLTPLSDHPDTMAKSSRASSVKKNNQRLKKTVFGPVETARNERLSAKLMALASQPKPPRTEMEIETDSMSR